MNERQDPPDEESSPVGALVFMAIYLLLLALGWLNIYLRLWFRS